MNRARFADLVTQLAGQLSRLRYETWTAQLDGPGDTYGYLAGGISRLSVYWLARDNRLQIDGLGPDGSRLKRYGITVSPDRAPWAIAGDINRRLISAGYLDDLLAAYADKAERDKAENGKAALMARAAGLFGVAPPQLVRDTGCNLEAHELRLSQFVKGSGSVKASYEDGCLDIHLSGIPGEVALGMLAVLARHVSSQVRCCRAYGPGHPPQFSVVGCLREKSARGEVASSNRVATLLTDHGVPAADVGKALDEARDSGYQVSVVERDGQMLAVVTWNREGCGEFTVELARKDAQP